MLPFGVKGGYDAGIKVANNLRLFSQLANLGDVRSLVIHPASTTHRQVRLSVGIESLADLIADLKCALETV